MARLTRAQVKTEVVGPALKTVADFDGDFEDFTFTHFHDFSMSVFLKSIADHLEKLNYQVTLNEDIAAGWTTLKDCVDYVYNEYTELW